MMLPDDYVDGRQGGASSSSVTKANLVRGWTWSRALPNGIPIEGDWRHGRAESRLVDTNPYTDDVLLEIKQADRSDLDAAFAGGAKAQVEWAASAPPARAHVFRRAAEI